MTLTDNKLKVIFYIFWYVKKTCKNIIRLFGLKVNLQTSAQLPKDKRLANLRKSSSKTEDRPTKI